MATLSEAARNAALDAITALLDSGASRCAIRLYTAGFSTLVFNSFLQSSEPSFPAASGGSVSPNTVPFTLAAAIASGTLAGYSIDNTSASVIFSVSGVGLVGSGADIELTSLSVAAGQFVVFSSFTLSIA